MAPDGHPEPPRAQVPLRRVNQAVGQNQRGNQPGIIKALEKYRVETITYDNGLEFSKHAEVSVVLGSEGYFCKPYSSWKMSGVENSNGLVRQYYRKECDLSEVHQPAMDEVEAELNDRPRKILGYKSPSQHSTQLAA